MAGRKHHSISYLLIVVLVIAIVVPPAFAEDTGLSVVRITPSGDDVDAGRQIVVEFNRPVVPIGRMERNADEVPVSISPDPGCEWRWLNTSSLACQLNEKNALKTSTRYKVTVSKDLKTADGAVLEEGLEQSFLTARPAVSYAWFKHWDGALKPNIYMTFNQQVEQSAIDQHIYFEDVKTKARYPARAKLDGDELVNPWVIAPRDELPADSEISLKVEPGLVSKEGGGERGSEDREILNFATFADFRFVGLRCSAKAPGKLKASSEDESQEEESDESTAGQIEVTAGEPLEKIGLCNPMASVSLLFSAPIDLDTVEKSLKFEPDLRGGREDYDPWENFYRAKEYTGGNFKDSNYPLWLPIPLKAEDIYKVQAEAGSLKDLFGRPLKEAFNFSFKTDNRPPKFHLNNKLSVMEKETDSHLPVIVTNLDKLNLEYEALTAKSKYKKQKSALELYPARDIAYPFPVKVRELLKGKSGVIYGSMEGVTEQTRARTWFLSQITPFNLHAKLGHFNTLIWATGFADGQPVSDAKVSVLKGKLTELKQAKEISKAVISDKYGLAELPGLQELDPNLDYASAWRDEDERLLIKLEKGDDISILPISYAFDLSYESMYPYSRRRFGHVSAWGTTAQGIYKLGDTIQYKIYLRDQNIKTLVPAPKETYILRVYDPAGNKVTERGDIKLNEFGAFDGELELLSSWPVGWYSFELASSYTTLRLSPLKVLVTDFTPAPFKVETVLDKIALHSGESMEVRSEARLHAGGPYTEAVVRQTGHLSTARPSFEVPAIEDFEFGYGDRVSAQEVFRKEDSLDKTGNFSFSHSVAVNNIYSGKLYVESAVTDDRGKRIVSGETVEYLSRDRFLGLKNEDWILTQDQPAIVQAVAVDAKGNLQANADIEIDFEKEEVITAKVKSSGNAYLSHEETEWKKIDSCQIKSAGTPVECKFSVPSAGYYRFVGHLTDSKGQKVETVVERYASGKGYVSWASDTSNTLKITPEKKSYKPGETARYLVQNPYPGAQALITIERYGIIDSWTKQLTEGTEVIEIPVTADLFPGFYLSVVVMAGRADKPIENQVDLGKPVFKIGYVKTDVSDNSRELAVKIIPEKPEYKPRDLVRVNLELQTALPKDDQVELAVAVLDQAVFDLIASGRNNFDPFSGFYSLESLDVKNFNLLKQIIGRQKFEAKGAVQGGGGGGDLDMRSLFKFMAYWNPSLVMENGKAEVEFTVPDNLTAWKVLVLAVNKSDRMGLSTENFKVNQKLEIRPALPNILRETDTVQANFTLMNRTETPRKVNYEIEVEGSSVEAAKVSKDVELAPFKRELVGVPVKVNAAGEIVFKVKAGDATDQDALISKLTVYPRSSLETASNFGSTTENKATEAIQFPENIRTDVGGVSLRVSPTVISGLDSAFTYIKTYPYSCWEQKLAKAVMAAHYPGLKQYLSEDLEWKESRKIVEEVLAEAANYQAPGGGMTFFVARDEYANPYLSAYTSLAFVWLSELGYSVPETVVAKLDAYLLEILRKDDLLDYYVKGMTAGVKAVALSSLALRDKLKPKDLKRLQPELEKMDLFGKSHFLIAASRMKGTEEIQKKTVEMLMSASNQTGGKYVFSESLDAVFQRILTSTVRTQCAVLTGLLAAKGSLKAGLKVREDTFFKTVRTISQSRTADGHWENTQENIFCVRALLSFSQNFEKGASNFSYTASLGDEKFAEGKFNRPTDASQVNARPLTPEDTGKTLTLEIDKKGSGRMYYQTTLQFSPLTLKTDPINSGMEIKREVSVQRNNAWELMKPPYAVKQGDLLRVDLFLSLPAARNYVVVSDPVAGGLEPLNSDLATTSRTDALKGQQYMPGSYWYTYGEWIPFAFYTWGFYHKELRHESVRFYSEYLGADKYHLSYLAQAIAAGSFTMLPARAEEMYDPDVYAQGVPEELTISKQ